MPEAHKRQGFSLLALLQPAGIEVAENPDVPFSVVKTQALHMHQDPFLKRVGRSESNVIGLRRVVFSDRYFRTVSVNLSLILIRTIWRYQQPVDGTPKLLSL